MLLSSCTSSAKSCRLFIPCSFFTAKADLSQLQLLNKWLKWMWSVRKNAKFISLSFCHSMHNDIIALTQEYGAEWFLSDFFPSALLRPVVLNASWVRVNDEKAWTRTAAVACSFLLSLVDYYSASSCPQVFSPLLPCEHLIRSWHSLAATVVQENMSTSYSFKSCTWALCILC